MARHIHLLIRGKRVACGTILFSRTTTSPPYVTCRACQKAVGMADAEIAEQQTTRRFSD